VGKVERGSGEEEEEEEAACGKDVGLAFSGLKASRKVLFSVIKPLEKSSV
jgi:hypothetical protein